MSAEKHRENARRTPNRFLISRFATTLPRWIWALIILGFAPWAEAGERPEEYGVVVYGGTPAGIAAAISASDAGERVLLLEPYRHIGGMVTNGLSHTDLQTFEGMTGAFLDFAERVEKYYAKKYGPDSQQVRDSLHGSMGEPRVNRLVFEGMLHDRPEIIVRRQHQLESVALTEDEKRIATIDVRNATGKLATIRGRVFIDATYEGDLMAKAKVPYRVGREAKTEFNEPLAPEVADKRVQGYNFRLCMTQDPKLRVAPKAPPGYTRDDFLEVVPLLESGAIPAIFVYPAHGIYKAQVPRLPNAKYDINDVSRTAVRLSLPDINDEWPEASAARRKEIFDEHVRHNMGLIYFLQNDAAVPKKFQEEAQSWGWCRDEFTDNDHLPEQLYVREARRMEGMYVYTQNDVEPTQFEPRAPLRRDSIAMCDYQTNCHGTGHEGSRFGGRHTGDFYRPVSPHQVPYGVIVPRECKNLLVPVAISSSHVGYCALRYEAVWTMLGQAAGLAAHMANKENLPVQKVDALALQRVLHQRGAATIYVSDVPRDDESFLAVQWWANAGGLHGEPPGKFARGKPGKNISGQYHEAYPGHAANLEEALDASCRQRWLALVDSLKIAREKLIDTKTRGEFIRTAYQAHAEKQPATEAKR